MSRSHLPLEVNQMLRRWAREILRVRPQETQASLANKMGMRQASLNEFINDAMERKGLRVDSAQRLVAAYLQKEAGSTEAIQRFNELLRMSSREPTPLDIEIDAACSMAKTGMLSPEAVKLVLSRLDPVRDATRTRWQIIDDIRLAYEAATEALKALAQATPKRRAKPAGAKLTQDAVGEAPANTVGIAPRQRRKAN